MQDVKATLHYYFVVLEIFAGHFVDMLKCDDKLVNIFPIRIGNNVSCYCLQKYFIPTNY